MRIQTGGSSDTNVIRVNLRETAECGSRCANDGGESSGIIEVSGRKLGIKGESVYSCGEGVASRDAVVHLVWRNPPKTFVGSDVVGIYDARCEFGPSPIMVVRKDAHTAVSVSPKYLDGAVASSVVAKSGRGVGVGGFGNKLHKFGKELLGRVGVQDLGRAVLKNDAVKARADEGAGLSVRKRDDDCKAGGSVDEA